METAFGSLVSSENLANHLTLARVLGYLQNPRSALSNRNTWNIGFPRKLQVSTSVKHLWILHMTWRFTDKNKMTNLTLVALKIILVIIYMR